MTTILIRCGSLVAFDGARHRLIRDTTLLVRDDRVAHIGPEPEGDFDEVIDARRQIVLPGYVNIHTHTGSTVATRLVTERAYPALYNAGYLAFSPRVGATSNVGRLERAAVGGAASVVELLKSGTTTVVDLGQGCDYDEMVDVLGALGIRAYCGRGFRSGYHRFDADGRLDIHWLPDEGLGDLGRAVDFIERQRGRYDGRIQGTLLAYQGDTTSDRLLIETKEAAKALGVTMQMHAAQSLYELNEMLRRHGRTTVQHFADLGFLGPEFIIAHCPFITGHPSTGLPGDEDLCLLGRHGVHLAHNPTTLFRRGHLLRSFSRYRAAGMNIAIGTDHYPRDMAHEMRMANLMGKVTEDSPAAVTSMDVFNAATSGGADALGRPDLGRLYPGAKADLQIVDLRRFGAVPLRDPIQDIVLCAGPADVRQVLVDGRVVVRDGRIPGLDEERLLDALQANAEEILADIPSWQWQGMSADDIAPRFLEPMGEYAYRAAGDGNAPV
jgi:cytosine/adenosine deaminase-related metal-dependent hydrolase